MRWRHAATVLLFLAVADPPRAAAAEIRARFIGNMALHYSYLVDWSGLRLYFTGDTEDAGELLRQRDLDVAFVSPWLLGSATSGGRRIDARRIVVYHHQAGEAVPQIQGRELPQPGDELVLRKE